MPKPQLVKPDIRNTDELLAFHAQHFGGARMEDPPAAPPEVVPPAPAAPPEKMLSQSEVNRIAASEKEQGRAGALAQVQNDLGVDLETAKTIIAEAKKRADSELSESQRATKEAEDSRKAADAEKAEAAKERHEARVDRAFVGAGLTDEAKIARYSRLLDVEVGAKPEDIKKAVEKLKEEEPALFGAPAAAPGRPAAPGSDPKGGPPKPKTDESAFDRGKERAKSATRATTYASLTSGT